MLMMDRPVAEEVVALLTVASWWRRLDWDRVAVAIVVVFHLWMATTLTFAPSVQVFTQGSLPAFTLLPPGAWAVWLLVGGVAGVVLILRVTGTRQVLTWFLVFPPQAVWLGASVLAVLQGGGSAIGVVLWSVILLFTALAAIRLALAYTTGKR